MAVISMLAVVTLPALRGTLDGIAISGAAEVTAAELALARQTAISRNLPVDVRIYRHDDGNGPAWRMVALVIPASASGRSADEWLTNGRVLPAGVVFEDSNEFSTVLSTEANDPSVSPWRATEGSEAPPLLRNKDYVGFTFRPNGSTGLDGTAAWCLTLKNPRAQGTESAPAANFVSIVLDALTGRTLTYQP